MLRMICLILFLCLAVSSTCYSQKYSLNSSIAGTGGRPINGATVALFTPNTETKQYDLVYDANTPGMYYSTTPITAGLYDIKIKISGTWRTYRSNVMVSADGLLDVYVTQSTTAADDTTELKLQSALSDSIGLTRYLKKIGSSDTRGSGTLIQVDSAYLENGTVAYGTNINGKQWVRDDYHHHKKIYSSWSRDTTWSALRSFIGTDSVTLIVDSKLKMVNSDTIPKNVRTEILGNGRIHIASGTAYISGKLEAGLHRIKTGSGKIKFLVGSVSVVFPQWFGAAGDGVTIDTKAFNEALEQGSVGNVEVPVAVYFVDSTLTQSVSRVFFNENAQIKINNTFKGTQVWNNGTSTNALNYVYLENAFIKTDNVDFKNLTPPKDVFVFYGVSESSIFENIEISMDSSYFSKLMYLTDENAGGGQINRPIQIRINRFNSYFGANDTSACEYQIYADNGEGYLIEECNFNEGDTVITKAVIHMSATTSYSKGTVSINHNNFEMGRSDWGNGEHLLYLHGLGLTMIDNQIKTPGGLTSDSIVSIYSPTGSFNNEMSISVRNLVFQEASAITGGNQAMIEYPFLVSGDGDVSNFMNAVDSIVVISKYEYPGGSYSITTSKTDGTKLSISKHKVTALGSVAFEWSVKMPGSLTTTDSIIIKNPVFNSDFIRASNPNATKVWKIEAITRTGTTPYYYEAIMMKAFGGTVEVEEQSDVKTNFTLTSPNGTDCVLKTGVNMDNVWYRVRTTGTP